MKGGKYAKTLAKIQVGRVYFVYEISGEMFHPNFWSFVWKHHAGAHPNGHERGERKPTETSVNEFCYKSVNFLL